MDGYICKDCIHKKVCEWVPNPDVTCTDYLAELPTLSIANISDDIEKFKLIWERANSKGIPLVSERPQGEWKRLNKIRSKCSKCGFAFDDYGILFNFCPNCGADMRGK